MMSNFADVLNLVAAKPDVRLDDMMEMLADTERQQQLLKVEKLKEARLQKFKKIKPQTLNVQPVEQLEAV
jgi:hypothetical protein